MPRFYFDVRDDEDLVRDDQGVEFSDIEAARSEAAVALAEMARDVLSRSPRRRMAIEVRTEGEPLLRLSLAYDLERLSGAGGPVR